MTARTPLCAVVFGAPQIQVYYRDLQGRVAIVKNTGCWSNPYVIEGIGPGHNFAVAVLGWDGGERLRLYHQESSGVITEHCSNNDGQDWSPGELRVGE